jgi:hypothetical protein
VKRLGHIFLKLVTVVSVLLLAITAAVWVRSYFVLDQLNWFRGVECWSLEVERGELMLVHMAGEIDQGRWFAYRPGPAGRRVLSRSWWLLRWGGGRVEQVVGTRRGMADYRYFSMSLWPVAALLSIRPAALLLRRMRRVREPGRCATCGYDLRATPERCPECGTIAAR